MPDSFAARSKTAMRILIAAAEALKLKRIWCGRRDLNPHAVKRHPLKMVCLPISPLPHFGTTHSQLGPRSFRFKRTI